MKILISGSHGFIGSEVGDYLYHQGHTMLRLIRLKKIAKSDEVFWNPQKEFIEHLKLDGVDAVIHLAGENLYGRWNDKKKKAIRESRVVGTTFLSKTLAKLTEKPKVLICASGIGFYGDRGENECIETTGNGEGFLAEVAKVWEEATKPASDAGIRVVNLRLGIVLGKNGGALAKMLTPFKMGMGGPLGDGQQWVSWITIDDVVKVIDFILHNESLSGPVNIVAPMPVRNKEFAHALGRALHRPEVVPIPKRMLHFMFGEMAEETLLSSIRALPHKLQIEEFPFQHPDIHTALKSVLK